ncbi:hypothetical protein LCGC14_2394050, partial [marine sediment metagenome]
ACDCGLIGKVSGCDPGDTDSTSVSHPIFERGKMSVTKKCKVCAGNQLVEKFRSDRRSKDGLAAICIPCLDELETRVIHPAEHEVMFVKQNQGCAICKRREYISKILVDYDRRTQEVFGLVCRECNRALRDLKRDPTTVRAMLEYLTLNRG